MRKNLILYFALCICSLLILSGCDDIPIDMMEQTTSIVGKIGNINKNATTFLVKAYLEDNPDVQISECLVDENGFFQVILPHTGSYILKIDYAFADTFIEYTDPINYNEKLINPIKVIDGEITNIKEIYGSLEDIYVSKVISYINSESNISFTVEVRKEASISTGFFIDTRSTAEAISEFHSTIFDLHLMASNTISSSSPTFYNQGKTYPGFSKMYDYLIYNQTTTFIAIPINKYYMAEEDNMLYFPGKPAYAFNNVIYLWDENGNVYTP